MEAMSRGCASMLAVGCSQHPASMKMPDAEIRRTARTDLGRP
jgi:hypothetical protein